MKTAAQSRLLLIAMVVLAGLVVSASQIRALSGAAAPLAQSPAASLPFVEGAPPPLTIVALGVLVIGVTFARRLRKTDTRA